LKRDKALPGGARWPVVRGKQTLVACAVLAVRIPFHAVELLWSPRPFLRLTAIHLLLAVPFFWP
jgi:hypothetical protein